MSNAAIRISLISLLVLATACGGSRRARGTGGLDASSDSPFDAGTAPADEGIGGDAGIPIDGGGDFDAGSRDAGMRDAGPVGRCTHVGFVDMAASRTRANAMALQHSAIDNISGDPTTVLQLERYYELGATAGPQTVTLLDESYRTCSTCVLMQFECTLGTTVHDVSACRKTFLARAGTVVLTQEDAAGGQFAGALHGVEMVEVVIDGTTFESTVVPGGETWCIDDYVFSPERVDAF